MVLVKNMPNSPKTQTALGTLPLASGSAAPAPAPAGPSLFNIVAGTFKAAQNSVRGATGAAAARIRAAQGKAPASEVRESVKSILRIFADRKEWSKLAEVRTVSEAGLAKLLALPEKARTATDNIYQMILETFGAYMSQTVLAVISMPISNQINLINDDIRNSARIYYDAQSRYEKIRGQIDSYAAKNAVNRESNNRIGELVRLAWFSIEQLFREREASLVAARAFLNLQPKNRGAQVAAQKAMQAAAPSQVSLLTKKQEAVRQSLEAMLPKYTLEELGQMAAALNANNLPVNKGASKKGGRKSNRRTRRN